MAVVNLIGSYNYALVALSVLIAMFASYAALDLAGRVTAASGWTRTVWLLGGAGAMGTGIWSMHYIGMLAFILPIPVAYHWPTVLLSLFAAILASVVALGVVSRQKMGWFRALAGSVLMGAGIASMHYIGMAAMRLPALCQFNSFLVLLSVVFAVLISLAALWITFHFRDEKTGIGWGKTTGAVVMGAAIPVMHYTGMAAASFTPSGTPTDLSHAASISTLGTVGIAAVTLVVLGLALLTSWVDRRFAAQTLEVQEEKLQQSEAYLSEAQRLSHTGSFGWRTSTGEVLWSEETFRIFQYDRTLKPNVELILQRVHPEDVVFVKQTIERATQDRKDFDFEHRLLMPDRSVKYLRIVGRPSGDESGRLEFVGAVTDITERKRAEKKLRSSEESLLEAQKLSRTGSWRHDVSSGAVVVSPEIYRIHDIKPDDDASNTEFFFSRFHPEDRKRVVDLFERAEIEKTEFQVDYRIVLPDGTIKHLHTIGHPVVNESGDLVEFVGTAMDVTAAKEAEEALRRSESYLAEAQRLSHTGSWAGASGAGEIRYWSEECYRVLGFDPYRGLPRLETFFQRIHPDDQASTVEQLERASREKTGFEFDYRIVHPGGDVRDIHTVGHPVFSASGDVLEYVGTVIDITERKRAAALRDGESRILEMIARDAPLKEILEQLVRVVEAQFAGLLCSVLLLDDDGQHVRHGASPSLPQPYTKAIDGLCIGPKAGSCGTAMYRREPVVVTDILDDPLWEAYRDVAKPYGFRACWSTPILANSGNALGSFAMYYREPRSPIPAETRALEMATHLAGIAIERKLARTERERLRQAQADLAHINRVTTMGELTASLAHEVNQPIAAAVTSANSCYRWLAGDVPNLDKARAAAMRIVNDGTRAAEIISRIRLLFQKGASQQELVDVNEIIGELIVLLRGEVTRYSMAVRTELAADLPQVMGDRVQLQQVLMNLMINGIDAMKTVDGTRELAIKSQRAEEEQIVVCVSDTGVGLPPEQADRIFDAFFTTKPHGTGMGLRICRSIVESHGGRLWAVNNSARGADFYLTLPSKVEAHK
jgi:PAS domain S-box-containing protein